jgi:cobalt/nickel transport system permease protein
MHIPDGYLSPQTYLPLYGIMLPIWMKAAGRLKRTLKSRQVPLFAMSAAFCFVMMMFNFPFVGGITGHATGAAIIAILLGPAAAILSVSVALILQALLFGDGGITALGANCFNMAVLIPVTASLIYRVLSRGAAVQSFRRVVAGGVAGFCGLNLAALATGVEIGIQPLVAHNAAGQPLYAPFPMSIAVAGILSGHLLFFGFVEALVTALILLYFQKTDLSMLQLATCPPPITSACAARSTKDS